MDKLLTHYNILVDEKKITSDPVQIAVLEKLTCIYQGLVKQDHFLHRVFKQKNPIKGLYFWGTVGTGKTFMMDLFYNALPFEDKIRLHFHRFMNEVQLRLTELQGHKNPLDIVAKEFSERTRVLCFDEFFVNDIADAMILERLFTALFKHGLTLVTTSNIPPERLYLEGLHRARFLPAIALIKSCCDVFHVDSMQDYRLRELEKAGLYFTPLTNESQKKMEALFLVFAEGEEINNQPINIAHRDIPIIKQSKHIIWFNFAVICAPPRSQVDYLSIAEQYEVVFITGVPVMAANDLASITYFINLVDVFYDERVKLVISAEGLPPELYEFGDKAFEYKRTISRLQEMQSKAYLLERQRLLNNKKL
jgi:cell division protein ZapE